jgi:outer membrane protein OmpA-like peptidoglycan-associated protein
MRNFTALGLVVAFVGCAAAVPPEDLVTARATYYRAEHGPAAQLDPTDLHMARETLDNAEKSFTDDGDTQGVRDYAYTATRRVEIAESRARSLQAQQTTQAVTDKMNTDQASAVRNTSAALRLANGQIASQDQQITNERQRREDAERRAAEAAAALAAIGSVKQEARGMVLTLSGSVLFASAKSELLGDAQGKLNDVANVLSKEDPDARMVVEGHTDSQGGASYNQDLSQRRADSVRAYLVSHGVASDRVTAQGFGLTRPISDNTTAEGRANNRRVEIVVQNGAK